MGEDKDKEPTNYQKVEGRLYSYKLDKARLTTLKEELQVLLDNRVSISSPSNDDVQVSTHKVSDPTADAIIGTSEDADKKRHIIGYLEEKIKLTERGLGVLTHREREVVKYRYMDKREWVDVAAIVGISVSQCKRDKNKSINKIKDSIYPKINEIIENELPMSHE